MKTTCKCLMLAILLLASALLSMETELLDRPQEKEKEKVTLKRSLTYTPKDIRADVTTPGSNKKGEKTLCHLCAEGFNPDHIIQSSELQINGSCVGCAATHWSDEQLDGTMIKWHDETQYLSELHLDELKDRNDHYSVLQFVYNMIFCVIAFYQLVDNNDIVLTPGEHGMEKLKMIKLSLLKLMPAYYLFMSVLTVFHVFYRNSKRGLGVALKVLPNPAVTMLSVISFGALLGYFWGDAYDTVTLFTTLFAVFQQVILWLGNKGFMQTFDPSFVNMMKMNPQNSLNYLRGKVMSQEALAKIIVPSEGYMNQKMKYGLWFLQIVTVMGFSSSFSLLPHVNDTKDIGMQPTIGILWISCDCIVWLLIACVFFVKSIRGELAPIFTWNSISLAGFMGVMMGIQTISPLGKLLLSFGFLFIGVIVGIIREAFSH